MLIPRHLYGLLFLTIAASPATVLAASAPSSAACTMSFRQALAATETRQAALLRRYLVRCPRHRNAADARLRIEELTIPERPPEEWQPHPPPPPPTTGGASPPTTSSRPPNRGRFIVCPGDRRCPRRGGN